MTAPTKPASVVSVKRVLDDLGRQVRRLKDAGAYEQAAGMQDAVIRILRLADAGEPSIDPSENN